MSVSSPFRSRSGAKPPIVPFVDLPSGRLASAESHHSTGMSTWPRACRWTTIGRSALSLTRSTR
eukprot:5562637-Lingulodinium_polyedra.AAC.1